MPLAQNVKKFSPRLRRKTSPFFRLSVILPIKPRKRDRRLKGKEGGWPVPGKGSPPRNGRRKPPGPRKTVIWSDFGARARFPKFCAYNKAQPEIGPPPRQKSKKAKRQKAPGTRRSKRQTRHSEGNTPAPRSISRLGHHKGAGPPWPGAKKTPIN